MQRRPPAAAAPGCPHSSTLTTDRTTAHETHVTLGAARRLTGTGKNKGTVDGGAQLTQTPRPPPMAQRRVLLCPPQWVTLGDPEPPGPCVAFPTSDGVGSTLRTSPPPSPLSTTVTPPGPVLGWGGEHPPNFSPPPSPLSTTVTPRALCWDGVGSTLRTSPPPLSPLHDCHPPGPVLGWGGEHPPNFTVLNVGHCRRLRGGGGGAKGQQQHMSAEG